MVLAATLLTAAVALLHLYFLVLEMFLWEAPAGRRAFGLSAEMAKATRMLAANQGLYNGFLAAGLAWALWRGDAGFEMRVFFLACVMVAGAFGAATASRKILWIQALPAALALAASLLARG
jgi:putative membrane protein